MSTLSYRVVRYSIVALFLWFGLNQVLYPTHWLAYLPAWVSALPLTDITFIRLNGLVEVVLGAALALGAYTRLAAAVLSIHLFVIAATVGGDIGVRDAALAAVTGALAFSRPDAWSVDALIKKR